MRLYITDNCAYCKQVLKLINDLKREDEFEVINSKEARGRTEVIKIYPTLIYGKGVIEGSNVFDFISNGYLTDMNNLRCPYNKMRRCDIERCAFVVNLLSNDIPYKSCGARIHYMSAINNITIKQPEDVNIEEENCCN